MKCKILALIVILIFSNVQASITNFIRMNGYSITNYTTNNISSRYQCIRVEITGEIITNWTTISITHLIISESKYIYNIYNSDILNQNGIIKSNVLAIIEWKGILITNVLETIQIDTTMRSIPSYLVENPYLLKFN